MLEKEALYFEEHKVEIREKHLKKYIVIHGNSITGEYNSDEEAFSAASKTFEVGTFMIKYVSETDEEQIQRFTSLIYV